MQSESNLTIGACAGLASQQPYNFDELLHPAQAFRRPTDVVNDPDLTTGEKRAILVSWASDANAQGSRSSALVLLDDIIDALRMLDRQRRDRPLPRYRHILAKRGRGMIQRSSPRV